MRRLFESMYLRMPSFVQSLAVSFYGMQTNRKRHGEFFREHYKSLMQSLDASAEEHAKAQLVKLKALLEEVYTYCPYYARKIEEAGGIEKLKAMTDVSSVLGSLPVLERDVLRANMKHIVNQNPRRSTISVTNTSGTTGTPMSIEVDSESLQLTFAEWERYYHWIGLPSKFKSVRLSGRIIVKPNKDKKPFWVYNRASRQLFLSTYHLLPKNIEAYVDKLNSFKPDLIDGYPSAIYIIAKYINDNRLQLQFQPKAISTTAETLFDYQRAEIDMAFKCKTYNQYASSEGAPWIVECKCGNYHLWLDTGIFEFANVKRIDKDVRAAELIVTSFRALKTPLIRYRIADTIWLNNGQGKCDCGSNFPTVRAVVGRQDDILYTKEKGFVGRMDTAYKGLSGILRSKIVQRAIDSIDVLIIPTKEYNEDIEKRLRRNLVERLGNIVINIILVEHIPLGANGKFKAVECMLGEELTRASSN